MLEQLVQLPTTLLDLELNWETVRTTAIALHTMYNHHLHVHVHVYSVPVSVLVTDRTNNKWTFKGWYMYTCTLEVPLLILLGICGAYIVYGLVDTV